MAESSETEDLATVVAEFLSRWRGMGSAFEANAAWGDDAEEMDFRLRRALAAEKGWTVVNEGRYQAFYFRNSAGEQVGVWDLYLSTGPGDLTRLEVEIAELPDAG